MLTLVLSKAVEKEKKGGGGRLGEKSLKTVGTDRTSWDIVAKIIHSLRQPRNHHHHGCGQSSAKPFWRYVDTALALRKYHK